jgi:hypothetical protein
MLHGAFIHLMPSQVESQDSGATPLLAPGARVLGEPQPVAVEDVGLVQVWCLHRSSLRQAVSMYADSQHTCVNSQCIDL